MSTFFVDEELNYLTFSALSYGIYGRKQVDSFLTPLLLAITELETDYEGAICDKLPSRGLILGVR